MEVHEAEGGAVQHEAEGDRALRGGGGAGARGRTAAASIGKESGGKWVWENRHVCVSYPVREVMVAFACVLLLKDA